MEYVNDVNNASPAGMENTEVLMELNINGVMDTAYTYGVERLGIDRYTGYSGYYLYDPRGFRGGDGQRGMVVGILPL